MDQAKATEVVLIDKRRHPREFEKARQRPWKPVYLRTDQPPGYKAPMPFYVVYCDVCDLHSVQSPSGYEGKVRCVRCSGYAVAGSAVTAKLFRSAVVGAVVSVLILATLTLVVRLFL